jgi:hypothetical protein
MGCLRIHFPVLLCLQEDLMAEQNPSKTVAAELTRGLTRDDLDVLRRRAGLRSLPAGSLSSAVAEHGFSVEDLVTLLMAALVEKSDEAARHAREVERLKGLCREQMKAMDQIADQTTRLKSVLAALDPNQPAGAAMEHLKALAGNPLRKPN